ncbi:MAG: DMT family transporter [Defluviitaleaceae bacterium]|nr:DMT family transporter [Defluviitaleaceae bacterium]
MSRQTAAGVGFVFFAALLWSFSGLVIVTAATSPLWIIFIRSLTAGIILSPFIFKRKITPTKLILIAGTFFFIFQVSSVVCMLTGTAALAVSMQASAPIYTIIFCFFATKYLPIKKLLAFLFLLAGIGLALYDSWNYISPIAAVLGVIVGASFVVYTAALQKFETGRVMGIIAGINLVTAFLTLLVLPLDFYPVPSNFQTLSVLVLAGIIFIAGGYTLYGNGVKRVRIEVVLLIGLIEPVLLPLWVYIGIGEVPNMMMIFGMMFILVGAVLNIFSPIVQKEKKIEISI